MDSDNCFSFDISNQKSKTLYDTLLRTTTEGYWAIDIDAKTIEVNDALCYSLGYSRDEIIGRTPFEFCDEENLKLLKEQVAKIPVNDHRHYEITMDRKDGKKTHFIVNATTLRDDNGKPLGGFAFFTDITEKKEIEKSLKESEERNRLLSNLSVDGIVLIKDSLIADTNDALDKMLGYTREELLGRSPFDFVDPKFVDIAKEHHITRSEEPYEVVALKKDGVALPVELRGATIPYRGEEIRAVIVRDLTHIREAQNKIIEQKEFLQTLIDTIPVPIFYKNREGFYIGCNRAFMDVFGFDREEIIGKSVYDVAPLDIAKRYDEEDEKLYESKEGSQIYNFVVKNRKTGKKFDVIFHKSVYHDKDGRANGIIGAILDVTEINRLLEETKHLNEELQTMNEDLIDRVEREVNSRLDVVKEQEAQQAMLIQQSKMAALGEMIGAITHQWMQPLNVINMLASDIDEFYDDEFLISIQKKIFCQVDFMSQTMKDFKNFFKLEKELQAINPYEVSLKIVNMFKGQFEKRGIEIVLKQKESFSTLGYSNEFQHVLLNIFNNAKDAIVSSGENSGKIVCVFTKINGRGVIKISDNGGGIPTELLPETIFEPHISTKGDKGTGIGLYICKTIIQKSMKGSISAKNIAKGSEFTIELPLAGKTA
ncbi:MAG: PAS domain S-box protein [Campylobacterales bacterium]